MRKAVVVSLLALSLSIPAAPALAAHDTKTPSVSKPAKPAKPAKARFVAAGQLVSTDAAAATVTFRVHGGKDKALRGQLLTVTVATTTVIRRNDAVATLADLVAGDHVNVAGLRTASGYAASRVSVEGPITPTPTETPTPTPTVAPTPTPSETVAPV